MQPNSGLLRLDCVPLWPQVRRRLFAFSDLNRMKCEQRVWGELKHILSLFLAISNVLIHISPWQKKSFFFWGGGANIASVTRKLITFENCSNPVSPILTMEGSVYSRNTLCFIPAEGIDPIKFAFRCRGLNTSGVIPYGCNGLRNVLLVDATD